MMKSSYQHGLTFTLSGQSHDDYLSLTIDNIPRGYMIDLRQIDKNLKLRQGNEAFNTPRQDTIKYEIKSGLRLISETSYATTSEAIEVIFFNENSKSEDYDNILKQPRPGHVDYVAKMKYQDDHSLAGGGHFSGRMTLPLVFLGSLCQQILISQYPNLKIISHINSLASLKDIGYYDLRKFIVEKIVPKNIEDYSTIQLQLLVNRLNDNLHKILINGLNNPSFPVFNREVSQKMLGEANKLSDDSLGGQIETIIINAPAFIGEPFFYSFESVLANLLYSIPALKDVAFGNTEMFKNNKGSEVKDEIIFLDNKRLTTLFNHNGGINGGITNGEDIVFGTIIKPIASINQPQLTYNIEQKKLTKLEIKGRHDKTIINRVIPVIDALAYVAIYDLVLCKEEQSS